MPKNFSILTGAIFILVAIYLQAYYMGDAIFMLNAGLILSGLVWAAGGDWRGKPSQETILLYIAGIAVQTLHIAEEFLGGFHREMPGNFGYQWPDALFVTFNLIWLCIFLIALPGLMRQVWLAYLAVWFYVIVGGIGNGLFHPVVSIIQGSYFPGSITALAHLVIGIMLLRALMKDRKNARLSESQASGE